MNIEEWKPIETAPADEWILTYAEWMEPPFGVCKFTFTTEIEERLESESMNSKGRRKIIQEVEVKKRKWDGPHWEPTHWAPLEPPSKPISNI